MSWPLIFKIANASVIPAWFLLLVFPNRSITSRLVHSGAWSAALSILYTILLLYSFGGDGGMDSLENLKISFQRDEIMLLGWVHYLAFDLFIGAWISRDANRIGLHHLLVVPVLILTLFAGPVGLLIYLAIKTIKRS